jgi:hypothetical protein
MSLTLIFEDDLEGFSLEIDGKNQFDLSRRDDLDKQISSLETAFQNVYKGLDLEQFHFTVADLETIEPKIHIYMKSQNQEIEGLGVLSRKELFKLIEEMNKKQLEAVQSTVSSQFDSPGNNKNPSSVDAKNSEPKTPLTKGGAGKKTEPKKQFEISDVVDNNGNTLKDEYDVRTECISILEVSGETKIRRFAALTNNGRSLKFQVTGEDELLKIEISKLFRFPCNVEYDALSTEKQNYKEYRKITFGEHVDEFYSNLLKLKNFSNLQQTAELLAKINVMFAEK